MVASFSPPSTSNDELVARMRERGYAVLPAAGVAAFCAVPPDALQALAPTWDDLPPDEYLRDGGRYRQRRHSCFVVEPGRVVQAPHRPHWQSVDYNALHGGMQRRFEPLAGTVASAPVLEQVMAALGTLFSELRPEPRWFVEAHQFRIDTGDGIGRPTPEGAHRDGVDFVAVFLVGRYAIKGGETRVFQANGPDGQRFTLAEPWSVLLLDDQRVIHESTPIQPLEESGEGHRDTLVLTYRAGGFQGDDPA